MKILVIGSINVDIVNFVEKFPLKGQTIASLSREEFHGGKGANQAIACKRLSNQIDVSLFSKVGNDEYGDNEIKHLKNNGINTKFIYRSQNSKTGVASITVSNTEKDNMIIIDKGSNNDFDKNDLNNLEEAIKENDFILLQLETNDFLVKHAILFSKKHNKKIFLNPAPSQTIDESWIKNIDWFIPNETEINDIYHNFANKNEDIEKQSKFLISKGIKNILITLGEKGCLLVDRENTKHFKTIKVKAIDTTAAGDTFIGAFVSNLELLGVEKAIDFAMKAASITVSKKGAQDSIPYRKDLK